MRPDMPRREPPEDVSLRQLHLLAAVTGVLVFFAYLLSTALVEYMTHTSQILI